MSHPDAPGLSLPQRAPSAQSTPRSEIRVLALIDHLVLGGAEMMLGQFAAAAPEAGIRLSIACLCELDGNPAADPLRRAGAAPVNLDVPGPLRLQTLRAVRRQIAADQPDVVHTHLGDADVAGALAARSLGVPVISTIHTAAWDRDLQTYARRMIVRLCAARIIAVSEQARRNYLDRGFAREQQVITIRNGVNLVAEPGSGANLRRELGWAREDLVIGMLSALRAIKGHDLAVAAFRRLIAEFPTLRLLIVGRGRERGQIARMTEDLGDRVAILDHRFDVMRCFDAFDICLHPSHMEAFPTTLIEAMAASVPIVATSVGGIPEIVDDRVSGVLVPAPPVPEQIADALAQLLRDRHRRRRLGEAGRRRYEERFTVGPWLERTRALYDDVRCGAARTDSRLRRRAGAEARVG